MPDSKYGRLFTEADVLAFTFALSGVEPERIKARLAEAQTRFPADEPLFLLRGQDRAATEAIGNLIEEPELSRSYLQACRAHGASNDHIAAVHSASAAFEIWQEEHPDRVKAPD